MNFQIDLARTTRDYMTRDYVKMGILVIFRKAVKLKTHAFLYEYKYKK